MARGDIAAGKAFVELYVKNSKFVKGLRDGSRRLVAFGKEITAIGTKMMAMGGIVVAAMGAAVKHFISAGDQLDKLSARTGIAASSLAELQFAAEQSGTNLNQVENAVRRMQKTLGDARNGLSTAKRGLDNLGLSVSDFNGLNPDEQFQMIADRIAAIEDPTRRASAAMDVFGSRNGTAILPMLKNMRALREEARREGLVPTDEATKSAAQLTDAFNIVRRKVLAAVFEIGASLAPTLLEAATIVKNLVSVVQDWIKNNRETIVIVAKVAAGVVAAGAALTLIGGIITGVGMAMGALASVITTAAGVFTFILGVVGALFSPLGLLVIGIGAAVTAFLLFTDTGKGVVSSLKSTFSSVMAFFKDIFDTVMKTFGGIRDALMGGDLRLAGEIALTGLRIVFLKGIKALSDSIGGRMGDMFGAIGEKISGGDFQGAWEIAIGEMAALWDGFASGVVSTFAGVASQVTNMWQSATTKIATSLLETSMQDTVAGAAARQIIGRDLRGKDEQTDRMKVAGIEKARKALKDYRTELAAIEASGLTDDVDRLFELEFLINDAEKRLEAYGVKSDIIGDAKRFATEDIAGTADGIRGRIAEIDEAAKERARKSRDKSDARIEGGRAKADAEIARLEAELDELNKRAAAAREEAARRRDEEAAGLPAGDALKQRALAGFSLSNLALQVGPTQDPIKDVARHTKAAEKLLGFIGTSIEAIARASTMK